MDIELIAQIFSNYLFPMVACVVLFTQLQKQQTQHKEEMDKISEALNNNTLALQHLADRMASNEIRN